jgi:hypothetical protein
MTISLMNSLGFLDDPRPESEPLAMNSSGDFRVNTETFVSFVIES